MQNVMNSRQRVLTAVDHRTPDRLPITFDATSEVYETLQNHFGVSTRDEVLDALHVDTRLVGADHHDRLIRTEGELQFDFWGVGSKLQPYSGGVYRERCVFPLESAETVREIDAYDWPAPDELSFDSLRAARAANPEKAIIAHISHAGFFAAAHMRGLERLLMDFSLQPALAAAVIGGVNNYMFGAIERLCREAGDDFDIFYVADDFCTSKGPLLSPAAFRTFIQPYLRRYAEIVHGYGKKFLLHTCGSTRLLLPDIIAAGVDIMEPIQTSAVGMEVEGLKNDFGDRLSFYGGIDLVGVLNNGTPDDVRAEVVKNFHVLGSNGGYIVGPGHTYIQPDVPLQNIRTLYDTAYNECHYAHRVSLPE